MKAGNLRDRVTIQQPMVSQDAFGEPSTTWQDVAEVWAEVLELRGQQYLLAREEHASVTTKIAIRYRAGVRPTWRVVFGDHLYDVEHVVDLAGRRRELELMCSEVVA